MMLLIVLLIAASVVVGSVVLLGMFLSRSHSLSSRVGSFQCSMRDPNTGIFRVGVAHYGADRLDWFRLFSLDPRPAASWARGSFRIRARDEVRDSSGQLRPELYVVACQVGDGTIDLVMGRQSYSGLASWLEAAPPREAPVRY